ncbi:cytochrome c [Elioraea sp.]|uniref:c-type cytochrome n=1 Tax=Elioraea sp. TaxID=2185103 RepID=UPI0025C3EA27|nr:c-type cytochrome [Elioraea sp.]
MRDTLGAAALAAALLVPPPAAAADAARGASLAAPCAACHGADGNSTTPLVPSLAGQPPVFLTLQMVLFREGIRAVPAMNAAMEGITDRDVEDLAAHYAALPPHTDPPHADQPERDAAKAARGAALSVQHRCGVCHLPGYTGQNQMPRLAGQREDFLLHTMQDYQAQRRTGTDTTMNAALYGLSGQDLADLAHYLAIQR